MTAPLAPVDLDALHAQAWAACDAMTADRSRSRPHRVDVRFGGADLRLVLHGDRARDTLAWPFVPTVARDPALMIDVWDAATGVSVPWPPDAGRVVSDTRRQVFWEPHWVFGFDLDRRRGFLHCPDLAAVPSWSLAHPLLKLLHPWLRTHARYVVHAGAVGVAGRGVLIVGPSGSGKSTLSITAAQAGLDYLGDDYVAVAPAGLVAHGLYRIAKLAPDHIAQRVPAAMAHALPSPRDDLDKRLLAIEPTSMDQGLALVAIVVPEVTGQTPSRLTPIGPGRALRALAPSTLLQLPGFDSDFKVMADIARRLPAYHLPLGPDLAGATAELRRLCVEAP